VLHRLQKCGLVRATVANSIPVAHFVLI